MLPAPPREVSLLAILLQKCTVATSLRRARQLHALLLTSMDTHKESPFVHNHIIAMYARCGSLEDSRLLFEKMPLRNIVSYNSLISAYSRLPQHRHLAFRLASRLKNESLVPNESTLTSLLYSSVRYGNKMMGLPLHGICVARGFLSDDRVQTSLLMMYSSCGNVDSARKIFSLMMDKDSMAWNSIISGCLKNGKSMEGLGFFRSMLRNGITPTQFTYSMVLNACAKLRDHSSGRITHSQALTSGTLIDMPLQNALLHMYCSCRDTSTAFIVFSRTESPDLISWNSMINGFSESGDGGGAFRMFVQLGRVCSIKPDEYTFAAVISAVGGYPASYCGKPLHAQIEKAGFAKSVYIASTLLSMYFSNDDSESSHMIFSSFLYKDVVLWTDMIAWNCRIGESENAIKFFQDLCREGFRLDSFALSSALCASADLATLRQGEIIHSMVLKTGNDAEIFTHGSLVDMYAKNGKLKAAECIFSCLPKRDLTCWNSMLGGYAHHGKSNEAFQIFDDMLKHGLKPDHVTYLSLLATCSHCGLVNKSWVFWNHMKGSGLIPGPKHYSCMINLLSRAGFLEHAERLIDESPFADNYLELWRTVLSSCIRNGNLSAGIQAAEQILNINAEDNAANVLLTKLYAAAGRWNDVLETRRNMRYLVLEKEPGLSWIELRKEVHVFSSGDQSHMQNIEIRVELCNLLRNLMQNEAHDIG